MQFYLYKYISIKIIFSQQRKLTTYRFHTHSFFPLSSRIRSFAQQHRTYTHTLARAHAHSFSLRSCLPAMSYSVPLSIKSIKIGSIAKRAGHCRFGKKRRAHAFVSSRSVSAKIRFTVKSENGRNETKRRQVRQKLLHGF